jgi:hypothetical protein
MISAFLVDSVVFFGDLDFDFNILTALKGWVGLAP